jgi:hypothetical protein
MQNTKNFDAANANNEANNTFNNNNMKNTINFASVLGESAVAHTATVDQQVVTDLINVFKDAPKEVIMKFKEEDGFLMMVVDARQREKISRIYRTYADANLVQCMLCAMRNDNTSVLEEYKVEEHQLEAAEVDPRIDLFKQFMNSGLRCRLEADLVTNKGERFVCVTFTIASHRQVKFCLKRTEEIESIISEALKVA